MSDIGEISEAIGYIDAARELQNQSETEYEISKKNREIWIDSDIDIDLNTLDIVKQILHWNREDMGKPVEERRPIILYLFSCGGDLDICNAIIDAIQASSTPVYGVNIGRCLSAAAYIYISCHKRFMLNNSYFLFHQGSSGMQGDYSKMAAQMEDYMKQVAELSNTVAKFTNYSDEEIKKNITTEWYVRKDEALEKGVADKVIDNLDEVLF